MEKSGNSVNTARPRHEAIFEYRVGEIGRDGGQSRHDVGKGEDPDRSSCTRAQRKLERRESEGGKLGREGKKRRILNFSAQVSGVICRCEIVSKCTAKATRSVPSLDTNKTSPWTGEEACVIDLLQTKD